MILRRIYLRIFTGAFDYLEKYLSSAVLFLQLTLHNRILYACIKFLSEHLCPICLAKKQYTDRLGTVQDAQRRETLRTDTKTMQRSVIQARNKIFKQGAAVNGKAVTDILKHSRTPIRVSRIQIQLLFSYSFFRVHFQRLCYLLGLIFIKCLLQIHCMISSVVYGTIFLYILSVS